LLISDVDRISVELIIDRQCHYAIILSSEHRKDCFASIVQLLLEEKKAGWLCGNRTSYQTAFLIRLSTASQAANVAEFLIIGRNQSDC
jgi:hypothetical protein